MSNELALRSSAELPAVSGPPSPAEWQAMREQCEVILASGMAPKSLNTPQKVLAVCLKGRELRLPPMQALTHIHIVEGRPTLSAECMVALVQRARHKIRLVDSSAERAEVEGQRADDPGYTPRTVFTIEDAGRAGVASRGPWKQYPAAMLRARAISALCRFAFADVLMGASYVPEELGAEVNEEGEVIELPPETPEMSLEEQHNELMLKISERLEALPPEHRPDPHKVQQYAVKKLANARAALSDLNMKLEAALSAQEHEALHYAADHQGEEEQEVDI